MHAVQRDPALGEGAGFPVNAGPLRFSGPAGPTGEDGRPAVSYHCTRSDIRAFELNHPGRKDHGWLGVGVYVSTDPWVGHAYADAKRGDQGPTVMPLYAADKRPYIATQEEKNKLARGGPRDTKALTARLQSQGFDGVALVNSSGDVELVAFEPTQVKSARSSLRDCQAPEW